MSRGPSKQFDPDVALTKAMEVFWKYGYEATSLSRLLDHMGIGKKSLYDTFGNKRALFLKALEHYSTTTVADIRHRLLAEESSLATLGELLAEWKTDNSQPGSCGCMLGTNIADFNTDDVEVARVMQSYLRSLEDVFHGALARAQRRGELGPEQSPRELAQLLLCTTQGMALLGRVMSDGQMLDGALQSVLSLLEPSTDGALHA